MKLAQIPSRFAVLLLMLGFPLLAQAHTLGWGYFWLSIEPESIRVELQIPAEALAEKLGTPEIGPDAASNHVISERTREDVQRYVTQNFIVLANGAPLDIEFTPSWYGDKTTGGLEDIEGTRYVRLFAKMENPVAPGPIPDRIEITYNGLFDVDDELRHGLVIQNNVKTGLKDNHKQLRYVFAPGRETVDLNLVGDDPWYSRIYDFVIEGLYHIWIGLDHILFLVSLLLTAVMARPNKTWEPVEDFRASLINIVKLITIFTIAHATTLALALKGWVVLPARLVESIIALSIIAVVVDNFYPIFRRAKWSIVFVFGLFHGLGFAFILEELALDFNSKVLGLIGFNIGVELGQVAIVMVLLPVLFLMRKMSYSRVIMAPGSLVIGGIALLWFIQRAFEVDFGLAIG